MPIAMSNVGHPRDWSKHSNHLAFQPSHPLIKFNDLILCHPVPPPPGLVKIASGHLTKSFAAPILAASGGKAILVFATSGIYLLERDALTLIWSSEQAGRINGSGGTPPTYVAGWDGILFTTGIRNDTNFFLLKSCADSGPNAR